MKSLRLTKQTQRLIIDDKNASAKPSPFKVLAFLVSKIKLGGVPHFCKSAVIVFALFLIPTFSLASSLDDQINQTEQNLSQTKSTKRTLSGEVAAFDSQIGSIQSQINGTDADLTKTQNEITSTNNQIKQAEIDLAKTKDQLREYIRTMYEEGQVSNIELIAKSKNFSEFVDRNEYMVTMQLKIKGTSDKIVTLKAELEKKKKSLEGKKAKIEQLRQDQAWQRSALDGQRAGKNSLLQKTKGDEKAYQGTLNNLYTLRASLSAGNNETVSTGGGGGYPYSGSNPNGIDPWGFYYRQCTSFAAWHSATYGPVPGSVLSDWGHSHTANGGDWGNLGSSHGRSVSTTPSMGAIMSFPYQYGLPYGHVAIVTGISGGTVSVAEYNWSIPLGYGTRSGVDPGRWRAVFIR